MDRDAHHGGQPSALRTGIPVDPDPASLAAGRRHPGDPLARLRAAAGEARPSAKRSTLVRDSLMIIRRAHLYAGLLMLPWVLLYGLTGLLFNHPTWFSDQTVYAFDAEAMKGTALERLATPEEIARSVVATVEEKTGKSFRLVERGEARFERGGLSASLMVDGRAYVANLDPVEARGQIRQGPAPAGRGGAPAVGGGRGAAAGGGPATAGMERPREIGPNAAGGEGTGERRGGGSAVERGGRRGGRGQRPEAPGGAGRAGGDPDDPFAAVGPIVAEVPILDHMRAALPTIAARAGLPGRVEVAEVRAAALSFLVEGAGKTWRATYDLASGALAAQPDSAGPGQQGPGDLSTRRFLLRLHTTHGYPAEFNARWAWAVVVDIMSTLMIFWGLSGLFMWWQIKRTRRVGTVALTLSAVMAAWVFVEMHQELAGLVR